MRNQPRVIHGPCDGCADFIRDALAKICDIKIHTTGPDDPGPYGKTKFICPHGSRYWPVPKETP